MRAIHPRGDGPVAREQRILDAMRAPILLTDAVGRIIDCNLAAIAHGIHHAAEVAARLLMPMARAVEWIVSAIGSGVFGLVVEAVNLGYRVVVATDAVAGVPASYAQDVLDNSIRMLATLRTVDQIAAAWS